MRSPCVRCEKTNDRDAYEEIVFGVLEDHVDGFVLEDYLCEGDDILMTDLSIQLGFTVVRKQNFIVHETYRYFPNRTLAYSSVRDDFALLVRFELLYRMELVLAAGGLRLVNTAVCTG